MTAPGAVGEQHVVGDPDGHLLAVQAVGDIGAGEDAVLFLLGGQALDLGLVRAPCRYTPPRLCAAVGSGELGHQRVLRGQHHEGHAEDGVGAGGEDPYLFLRHARDSPGRRRSRRPRCAPPSWAAWS